MPPVFTPIVVLLGQHCPDQANDCLPAGEDAPAPDRDCEWRGLGAGPLLASRGVA